MTLHQRPAAPTKENATMTAPPGVSSEPGPILIIDDEPYILRSLSYLLTREGYVTETVNNGEDGLQRVRALHPAIVFLDIMMPRMDGYEVCEHIRQDPDIEGTYLIMLSAKGQQVDRERGLLGGADEYMTKPFSPREVAQRVRTLLAARDARQQRVAGEA
jgi:two-component system alkaline phosphatase synthesis response regulator PhoP